MSKAGSRQGCQPGAASLLGLTPALTPLPCACGWHVSQHARTRRQGALRSIEGLLWLLWVMCALSQAAAVSSPLRFQQTGDGIYAQCCNTLQGPGRCSSRSLPATCVACCSTPSVDPDGHAGKAQDRWHTQGPAQRQRRACHTPLRETDVLRAAGARPNRTHIDLLSLYIPMYDAYQSTLEDNNKWACSGVGNAIELTGRSREATILQLLAALWLS